jgi:chemotaxis protein CheC
MPAADAAGLTLGDLDILQELLNIAFGTASAELAARLDHRVVLSVPDVQVIPSVLLRYYVGAELKEQRAISVVEQEFGGDFHGSAFLVLPASATASLLALLPAGPERPAAERARAALAEAGKILIGTCLARLAELLGTAVTCGPQAVTVEAQRGAAVRPDLFGTGNPAVVLRTAFNFGHADVPGYLFLASSDAAMRWLRPALHRFMTQYE